MTEQEEIAMLLVQIELLGALMRYTHWTGGHQGGAFMMGPEGWRGECGEWRKTAVEAWRDAERIATTLACQRQLELAEAEARRVIK